MILSEYSIILCDLKKEIRRKFNVESLPPVNVNQIQGTVL